MNSASDSVVNLTKPGSASEAESSLLAFLPVFEQGINRFINGDPRFGGSNASRRDDATIMGAWGGYERSWREVGSRYDWAAARFQKSDATVAVETLSSYVSGDLAYTVAVETSEALVTGRVKAAPMTLRVTHIFRREEGVWKLLHRHADPLIDKTEALSVLGPGCQIEE